MATYTGQPVEISKPIEDVYTAISDIKGYQQKLESLPPEARAKIGNVRFDEDTIVITAMPVGEISFNVTEKNPPHDIVLESAQSPVPLLLGVHLKEISPALTQVVSEIDVDIPVFLKPMIGGKMQEAADKFGELIKSFFA